MFDKMKQLMEMKKQTDLIKRELEANNIESEDVRGIKIVMNGAQNIKSVEIEASLLGAENKKKLESDLLRSFNSAVRKSQNLAAEKMKSLMPGFPGL